MARYSKVFFLLDPSFLRTFQFDNREIVATKLPTTQPNQVEPSTVLDTQNMEPSPLARRAINEFDDTVHGAPLLVPRNVRTFRERIRQTLGPSEWEIYDNYFVGICRDAPSADLYVDPMQHLVEMNTSIISIHNVLAVTMNPQLRGIPRLPIIHQPKEGSSKDNAAKEISIPDEESLPRAPEPYTWHPPSNWNDPGCRPHWSAPDMHEDYYAKDPTTSYHKPRCFKNPLLSNNVSAENLRGTIEVFNSSFRSSNDLTVERGTNGTSMMSSSKSPDYNAYSFVSTRKVFSIKPRTVSCQSEALGKHPTVPEFIKLLG
ncbi:hypothetical protein K491DRAFT_673222 [Lophiostoma macrostomum CBS 122681]|uniref:Uncharacterized protein n=1 Tax=Lophiostoma macrostomum CBS 122681 TaxID=1314788 RepID=A0A6A6TQP1_9PLEO|nr:hypothetical protein K491DRAFT_673222 [Lophiostoma macrostomum CBS 122681]